MAQPAIGESFNLWTVVSEAKKRGYSRYYLCRCRCGRLKEVFVSNLKKGLSKSCGCQRDALTSVRSRTHGMSRKTEYQAWSGAKARCYRPTCKSFIDYGAVGIRMCDRWLNSFEAFYADMGAKPYPSATIERIDSSGHYEPSNCRWASKAEQSRNTNRNLIISHNGMTMTASEWSRKIGGNDLIVSCRIRRGWSIEDAITIPPMPMQDNWRGRRYTRQPAKNRPHG